MKCRHFLSFVLVLFLSFFFGSFITTSNTFATSVNCGSFNITSNYNFFSCDTSSLNSSVDWYYVFSFDIQGDFSSLTSSNMTVSFGNSYISNPPIGYPVYGVSPSFNRSMISYMLSFPVIVNDSRRAISDNQNERISVVFFGNITWLNLATTKTFSVIIYDSFGSSPSGNLDITSNGTYDVTNYATATVDVPAQVIQGDYHDDLVNINQSIIVCGAILLVLYFFYCIYRLIIKNSGVH